MEIRFIKEYRALLDDGCCRTYQAGQTWYVHITLAQWLIDNGFAEKVEERWPREGDKYWLVDTDGDTVCVKWENDEQDDKLKAIGNVFKTEELARRFIDYLKAVETVRHDEGFMKKESDCYVSSIVENSVVGAVINSVAFRQHAGEFYFDTYEHAEASLEVHRSEWQTILNYDWSRE